MAWSSSSTKSLGHSFSLSLSLPSNCLSSWHYPWPNPVPQITVWGLCLMPSLKYFLSTEQEAFLATGALNSYPISLKALTRKRWSFLTAVRKVLGSTHWPKLEAQAPPWSSICGQEVRCACWKIAISSPQITWNRCPQGREVLLPQENRRCQPNKEQIPLRCLQSYEMAWVIFLSI